MGECCVWVVVVCGVGDDGLCSWCRLCGGWVIVMWVFEFVGVRVCGGEVVRCFIRWAFLLCILGPLCPWVW